MIARIYINMHFLTVTVLDEVLNSGLEVTLGNFTTKVSMWAAGHSESISPPSPQGRLVPCYCAKRRVDQAQRKFEGMWVEHSADGR